MSERAEAIARFLKARGLDVRYPGLPGTPDAELAGRQMAMGGSLIAFRLPGGLEQAARFFDALEIIDIGNNLGDAKSIAAHPWTTTHRALPEDTRRALGIDEGLVRLSVGLEDVDDLIADLDQALARAGV